MNTRRRGMANHSYERAASDSGWRPLAISVLFLVASAAIVNGPRARADAGRESASPDRWIAADALACLEVARPDRLIGRATDPQTQEYLKLFPQYQKLLKDKKLAELSSVVKLIAAQLDTTWDKGLGDLIGGGILAAFEAEAAQPLRFYLIITPKDSGLLERANQALLKLVRAGRQE